MGAAGSAQGVRQDGVFSDLDPVVLIARVLIVDPVPCAGEELVAVVLGRIPRIPLRGIERIERPVILGVRVDGVAGEGVCRVCNHAARCQCRHVGRGHKFVREREPFGVEVLDHQQREEVLRVGAVVEDVIIAVVEVAPVIRDEDDARVVVHAVFAHIVKPLAELHQRGHVGVIVRKLDILLHGDRLAVNGEAVRVRFVILRVVHGAGDGIVRLLQQHGGVRGVVGHEQERVVPVLGGLRDRREVGQHMIAHEKPCAHTGGGMGAGDRLLDVMLLLRLCGAAVIIAVVVEDRLHGDWARLHEAVAEEISHIRADPALWARARFKSAEGDVAMNVRIIGKDGQVGHPLIVGVDGVKDRDVKAVLIEENRHHFERFVVLVDQLLVLAQVDLFDRVFVSAHKRRCAEVGVGAGGDNVRIGGEAVKLRLQLRLFVEDIRQECAHGAVEHEHDDVFAGLAHGVFRHAVARLRGLADVCDLRVDVADVDRQHDGDGQNERERCLEHVLVQVPEEQVHDAGGGRDCEQVAPELFGGKMHAVFKAERGREHAEVLAEEHEVHDRHADEYPQNLLKGDLALRAGQPVEDAEPDDKGADGEAQAVDDEPDRAVVHLHVHEFLRGRRDDGCRDIPADEQRQERGAAKEDLCVRLGGGLVGGGLLRADQPHDQGQHQRRAQKQQRGLDDRPLGEGIAHETERQQRRTGDGGQDLEHPPRILELVEDGLDEGEDVVERPVKHQTGGGGVQEKQEEHRHRVQLDLRLGRCALREDDARDEVDRRHDDGQEVDVHAGDGNQPVGGAEVGDRPEGHALDELQPGQEAVGGDEKRDLQKQRHRTAQNIRGLIVVLAVVGLQDHHLLVAAERLFDVRHAAVQAGLHVALLFLQRVGPHVERQHQKVHDQAQHDDGQAGVADHTVGVDIDDLKQKLQRLQQQGIQYLKKCHGSFSSCVAVSSFIFCSR